jgi:hypothetical protein
MSILLTALADPSNDIKEDIKPVVQFAMDWAVQAALAATSTHAFVVVCKRFLQ